jgi:hypothetical protein
MQTRTKRLKKRKNFSYKFAFELNFAIINGLGNQVVKIVVNPNVYIFVHSVVRKIEIKVPVPVQQGAAQPGHQQHADPSV